MAMDNMTNNLSAELETFEERMQEDKTLVQVSWDKSRGGGGSVSLTLVMLLLLAILRNRLVPANNYAERFVTP